MTTLHDVPDAGGPPARSLVDVADALLKANIRIVALLPGEQQAPLTGDP